MPSISRPVFHYHHDVRLDSESCLQIIHLSTFTVIEVRSRVQSGCTYISRKAEIRNAGKLAVVTKSVFACRIQSWSLDFNLEFGMLTSYCPSRTFGLSTISETFDPDAVPREDISDENKPQRKPKERFLARSLFRAPSKRHQHHQSSDRVISEPLPFQRGLRDKHVNAATSTKNSVFPRRKNLRNSLEDFESQDELTSKTMSEQSNDERLEGMANSVHFEVEDGVMPSLTRYPSQWSPYLNGDFGSVEMNPSSSRPCSQNLKLSLSAEAAITGRSYNFSCEPQKNVPKIQILLSPADEQTRPPRTQDPRLLQPTASDTPLESICHPPRVENGDVPPLFLDHESSDPEDEVAEIHLSDQVDGAICSDDSASTLKPGEVSSPSSLGSSNDGISSIQSTDRHDARQTNDFPYFQSLETHVKDMIITNAVRDRVTDGKHWLIRPAYYEGSLRERRPASHRKFNLDSGILRINKAWADAAAETLYGQHTFLFQDPRVFRWWLERIGSNAGRLRHVELYLLTGPVDGSGDCETFYDKLWCKVLQMWKSQLHLTTLALSFQEWRHFRADKDDSQWHLCGRWREELLVLLMGWRGLQQVDVIPGLFHWNTRGGVRWPKELWHSLEQAMVLKAGETGEVEVLLKLLVQDEQIRRKVGIGKGMRF